MKTRTPMEMSAPDEKLDMLRHMLGINDPGVALPAKYSRDYAAADPEDPLFHAMEADGLVKCYKRAYGSYDWYTTTEAGKAAAVVSFKARQYTRAKRRYIAWLRVSDCSPSLTFREYLTSPVWADHRRNV